MFTYYNLIIHFFLFLQLQYFVITCAINKYFYFNYNFVFEGNNDCYWSVEFYCYFEQIEKKID